MSFAGLPPEVTSTQMYSGAGSGPMLTAAAAWAGLGSELSSAADSFSSVVSDLVNGSWQGAASAAMAAVATQYWQWLSAAAGHAEASATHATSIAGIFEAAKAAVTHPAAVAANRSQFVSLVRSNLFGFNAPAIAATEGAYEGMWADNVTALAGYHGAASAVAEQLASSHQALPNPAAVTPSKLKVALQAVINNDVVAINQQIDLNRNTATAARQITRTDLTAAGTALTKLQLGNAATDVVAAALVNVGATLALVSANATFVPELIGVSIGQLGVALGP
ncbi:PPE family protein [Mycobacterium conspicuum]|uniref:PPE family protein n=1 Tax=Mycobacterium conspicuum TaxID=44010 RepID=UPI000A168A54